MSSKTTRTGTGETPVDSTLTYYPAPINFTDPKCQRCFVASVGQNSHSTDWKRSDTITTIESLIRILSVHEESAKKDGRAIVLADMVRGRRLATAVKAIYGIGLDFDFGTPLEEIYKAVIRLGVLSIVYTTHSHWKTTSEFSRDEILKFEPSADEIDSALVRRYLSEKKHWHSSIVQTVEVTGEDHTKKGIVVCISHRPMPKCRVILPLLEPFEIAKVAPTQRAAIELWKKIPTAMAELLGFGDAIDKSATDPSRLFYLPRHAKGMPWEIRVFDGPLLDWRTLELESPLDAVANAIGKKGGKSKTSEGKALGAWSSKHAKGFQIAELLRTESDEKIRDNKGDKVEIECPFDAGHSNAGDPDDRACFAVNASDGESPVFVISCRHNSCREFTNLDHLGKMIADGWFDREAIDDENYHGEMPDEETPPPKVTEATIREAIAALPKKASADAVGEITSQIADCEFLSNVAREEFVLALSGKSCIPKKTLRAEIDGKRAEKRYGETASQSNRLHARFGIELGREFAYPPAYLGSFHISERGDQRWLSRKSEDDDGRLSSPMMLQGAIRYVDRDQHEAMRINVRQKDGVWNAIDFDSGDLCFGKGAHVVKKLREAGAAFTSRGVDFWVSYLLETQLESSPVYHRPGFRDGMFVCPTGEVIGAGGRFAELDKTIRLECAAKRGSFEQWKAGTNWLFTASDRFQLQAAALYGLAGTIADLLRSDPLAVSLEGPSTSGKSTAQGLAAGNWADPKLGNGLFISAQGTENSQEVPNERASGTTSCLDEVGSLPAKAQQELMFRLQGLMGKRRLNQKSEERKARSWGGLTLIVSAETGFAERLREEGVKQVGGLSVRCIPISTSDAPDFTPEEFKWIDMMLQNFGHSGPAFVRYLYDAGHVAEPKTLRERLEKYQTLIAGPGAKPYQRRAARMVAFLWLAGELAVLAGLIPAAFDMETLSKRVWAGVLESELAPVDPMKKAFETLCENVTALRGSKIIPMEEIGESHSEVWGFLHEHNPLDRASPKDSVLVIRSTKLAELCGNAAEGLALRKWLATADILIKNAKGGYTHSGYTGLGKEGQYVVLRLEKIMTPG